MAIAALRVFHIFPMIHLEVKTEEVQWKRKTPFVFIGNNNYDFDLFNLGSRDSLSQGKLFIYYSKCKHRICLLSIAIKALFGMLTNEKDFISKPVTEVVIDSRKKRISVAADGELYEMNLPLKYKIIPKAVKLVVPKK